MQPRASRRRRREQAELYNFSGVADAGLQLSASDSMP
jgi:hypothetical protein